MANANVKPAKTGHGPHSSYFLCCSMYYLFCVVFCIVCVYMYTELLPPCGYPIAVKYISYHIISYHIISYHIISYHIISYRIISYISYHIYIIPYRTSYHMVYHIISYIIPYIILYHIPCKLSSTDHINIRNKMCLGKRELLNIFMFNKDFGS
jgi:hypothetical protein